MLYIKGRAEVLLSPIPRVAKLVKCLTLDQKGVGSNPAGDSDVFL